MFHRAVTAAAVVAVSAPALLAQHPGSGPTISQFMKIRVPGQVDLAPDGSVYTRDFPDGIFQLYRRAASEPIQSQGKRLTDFPDGLASYSVSPDGRWVALEAAAGGNENFQVSLLNTKSDQVTPVLQNASVRYSMDAWARDGSGFYYTANDTSPRDFYVYKYDIASKTSTNLLSRPGQWFVVDATNDGGRILVSEYRSISDSSIYVLDTATGALTDLTATPPGGTAANTPVGFTTDEKGIFFESDFESGIVQLYTRDARDPSVAPRAVLQALNKHDIDSATLNHERSLLATVHNEDGYGKLRVFHLPGVTAVMTTPPPPSVVGVADFEGRTLVYSVTNATTPGITYALPIQQPQERVLGNSAPLTTRMDSEPIDLSRFRLPELVKIPSFDGLEIPAFLYMPEGAAKGKPVPFVVNYHGGPEGQFRPGFDRTTQYLVSRGYGVLQPNVRGSTGYGREYHMMDNYKKRWDSVKDGAEAARWLVTQGYARAGEIAAYGGSYGGFMSVACVIEGADVFGACINVVGVVNLKTFLEKTSGYRQKLREVEYGPLSDPEFLLSVSPLERVSEIKTPMFIAHGANDPRVPLNEAILLAVALQKRGEDPELLFFPDEGHGFAKLENRILFAERAVKFLDRHIGPSRTKP